MVTNGNQVNGNGTSEGGGGALSLPMYDRIVDPMKAAEAFGNAISGSGMFGVAGAKQGMILALECMARRMPPLMLAETYHVIHGKLSMRAEKMLANFNEAGGKHRILSRTGDLASIELTYQGQTTVFSLSWEEAQQEPFVYNGKEDEVVKLLMSGAKGREALKSKIKPKYATPRARTQMMWARVVSDGVNAVFPAARQGCYTPEEVSDYVEGNGHAVNGTAAGASVSQGEVIDGEFEVVDDEATTGATEATAEDSKGDDHQPLADSAGTAEGTAEQAVAEKPSEYATASQSNRLNDLYVQFGMSAEQIEKALKKRGASTNRGLLFEVANEFIATLEKAVAAKAEKDAAEAGEVAGQSRQTPGNETTNPGGPATPGQVKECQQLLVELNQIQAGSVNKFKAHLKAQGLEKVSDLSAGDAEVLLADLRKKTLVTFFDRSLEGWKPKQGSGEVAGEGAASEASEAAGDPASKN